MAYVITDECSKCASCADACPTDGIKETEDKFEIDPALCEECGICVDYCPCDAILPMLKEAVPVAE